MDIFILSLFCFVFGLALGVGVGYLWCKAYTEPQIYWIGGDDDDDDGPEVEIEVDDDDEDDEKAIPDIPEDAHPALKHILKADPEAQFAVKQETRWGKVWAVETTDGESFVLFPEGHPWVVCSRTLEKADIEFSSFPQAWQDELCVLALDAESEGLQAQESAVLDRARQLISEYTIGG